VNKRKPLHVKGHAVKGDGIEWKQTEMLDMKMQIVFRRKLCHRETLHAEKRNLKKCLTCIGTVAAVCITSYNIKKKGYSAITHCSSHTNYIPQNH